MSGKILNGIGLVQQLESKTATIRRLRSLLRTAVEFEDESMEEGNDDAGADSDADMAEETSEHPGESDTLSDNDPENDTYAGPAIWDDIDKVYRCSECLFEVEEGYCRTCNLTHDWDAVSTCPFSFSERVFFLTPIRQNDERNQASVSVASHAASDDRCMSRRGTTPLVEPDPQVIASYSGSRFEYYRNLIERGATPVMCDTFNLEYTPYNGIVAWADQSIFDAFAGPGMPEGNKWKIYLGRRIQLDDGDLDGSEFIEDLLEDILYYPVGTWAVQWRTFEESPGVWATAPQLRNEEDDSDTDRIDEDDDGMYENDGANLPVNVQASPDRHRLYDAALQFPFRPNDRIVLELEEYETGGSCDEEEDELEDGDPSAIITARMPDTIYEEGNDVPMPQGDEAVANDIEEDNDDHPTGGDPMSQADEAVVNNIEDDNDHHPAGDDPMSQNDEAVVNDVEDNSGDDELDSDVPGSDWDSTEELSGDEIMPWRPEWHTPRHLDGRSWGL